MRSRPLLLLLGLLLALIVLDRLVRLGRERTAAPAVASTEGANRSSLPARSAPALRPGPGVIPEDPEAARQALREAGSSVYLGAMFAETDSAIRRWPDSLLGGLRVAYLTEGAPGWMPRDRELARQAFTAWERVGLGVRFTEVLDTTGAQIVVTWIPRFNMDRTGQADLEWDGAGRVRHARIQLALEDKTTHPISEDGLLAVALHEVGHALGLPHSDREEDLMFPTTRRPVMTTRDTATARLLYRLPNLSLKWTAPSSSP